MAGSQIATVQAGETDPVKLAFAIRELSSRLSKTSDFMNTVLDDETAALALATLFVGGQLPFPATQNPSADPNTLDDYEEGTWTPTLTCATPGNLAITYNIRDGFYTKIGNLVSISFALTTTVFTWTTATGAVSITGLPFASVNVANFRAYSTLIYDGYTKANCPHLSAGMAGNSSTLLLLSAGSGQAFAQTDITNLPTGGTPLFGGNMSYQAPT